MEGGRKLTRLADQDEWGKVMSLSGMETGSEAGRPETGSNTGEWRDADY